MLHDNYNPVNDFVGLYKNRLRAKGSACDYP